MPDSISKFHSFAFWINVGLAILNLFLIFIAPDTKEGLDAQKSNLLVAGLCAFSAVTFYIRLHNRSKSG